MAEDQGGGRPFTDELFNDEDPLGSALVGKAYTQQVLLFLPFELPAYYGSQQWRNAASVLDLGTGNGFYLKQLAAAFPAKSYRGIDVAPLQIAAAREGAASNVQFSCKDFFEEQGTYDVIILRFVAQHLPNLQAAFNHCHALLNPSGSLFVIEGLERRTFYLPDVETHGALITQLAAKRRSSGFDMDIASSLKSFIDRRLWDIGDNIEQIAPSTVDGCKRRILDMQLAIVDYISHTGVCQADFTNIRDEWFDWYGRDNSYGQECLLIVRLDRRSTA